MFDTQVVSYPFDDSRFHKKTSWLSSDGGIYSASPDDDFFRLVSSLYANGHPHMSSGDNCDLQVQGSPKVGEQRFARCCLQSFLAECFIRELERDRERHDMAIVDGIDRGRAEIAGLIYKNNDWTLFVDFELVVPIAN